MLGQGSALRMSEGDRCDSSLETHDLLYLKREHPWMRSAFSEGRWLILQAALDALPHERQTQGDIADHHLEVGMIVRNKALPHSSGPEADKVLAILGESPIRSLFQACYGGQRPHPLIRRAQCNRMRAGDYNHAHRDSEDDPDYTMAMVLYFSPPDAYRGGDLFFGEQEAFIRPECGSLVAFRADVLHGLTPVVQCHQARVSLILLFGEHLGPTGSSKG